MDFAEKGVDIGFAEKGADVGLAGKAADVGRAAGALLTAAGDPTCLFSFSDFGVAWVEAVPRRLDERTASFLGTGEGFLGRSLLLLPIRRAGN